MSAAALDSLVDLLTRTDRGQRRYSDAAIEHALPLFALRGGLAAPGSLDNALRLLLAGLVSRANIPTNAPATAQWAAVEAHYAKAPVQPELWAELLAWLTAELGLRPVSDAVAREHLAAFCATGAQPQVLGGGGRPPGTVPGGALARLKTR